MRSAALIVSMVTQICCTSHTWDLTEAPLLVSYNANSRVCGVQGVEIQLEKLRAKALHTKIKGENISTVKLLAIVPRKSLCLYHSQTQKGLS